MSNPPPAATSPRTPAARPPAGPPRAVIFDLDGTLFDSLLDIADAANQALQDCGFSPHPVAAYRTFVGDGVHVLFERALASRPHDPAEVAACAAAFSRAYAVTWNQQTRIYPGIPRLLEQLQAIPIPVAVLSNKPDPFVKQCVAHYFPQFPFAIVAGQKADVPRKPDPAAALDIATQLGLPPAQVAFVGDSSVDVLTACNAGMWAIGCSWGFRPAAELWEHGAHHVVDQPAQLAHLWQLPDAD